MPKNTTLKLFQFKQEMEQFAAAVQKNVATAVVDTAIDLHVEIVSRTPYETGTARANWNPSVGAPDLTVKPKQRYVQFAGEAISETAADTAREDAEKVFGPLRESKQLDSLYISNALDYISILEEGRNESAGRGSNQAPNGMVLLSLQKAEADINAKLK